MKINLTTRLDLFAGDRRDLLRTRNLSIVATLPTLLPAPRGEFELWWPGVFNDPVTDEVFPQWVHLRDDGSVLRREFLPTVDDYVDGEEEPDDT